MLYSFQFYENSVRFFWQRLYDKDQQSLEADASVSMEYIVYSIQYFIQYTGSLLWVYILRAYACYLNILTPPRSKGPLATKSRWELLQQHSIPVQYAYNAHTYHMQASQYRPYLRSRKLCTLINFFFVTVRYQKSCHNMQQALRACAHQVDKQ